MVVHDEPFFQIYFGDVTDQMYSQEYLLWQMSALYSKKRVREIIERFRLNSLSFLHQVHGVDGFNITSDEAKLMRPFSRKGDYLVTKEGGCGLGVVTADCLPVICYDKRAQAIGIAHVGWRGAVAGVVTKMVAHMSREWQTENADYIFYCGPGAKRCCYRVSNDFYKYLDRYPWAQKVIYRQPSGFYFDLPLFVQFQLADIGVCPRAVRMSYNSCTICDHRFYSHRRDMKSGEQVGGRQMTIVALK